MSKLKISTKLKKLEESVETQEAIDLEMSPLDRLLGEQFVITQSLRYPGAAPLEMVIPEDTTPEVYSEIQEALARGRGDVAEAKRWRAEMNSLNESMYANLGDDPRAHHEIIRKMGNDSITDTSLADAMYAAAKRLKREDMEE